jgi:deoxyribonuclease IV
MFGSHLSIAGSMCNALAEAQRLKMDTVQVFTKNQQQWKVAPLADSAVREWRAEVSRLGWGGGSGGGGAGGAGGHGRIAAHASYLINLASPADELWEKSIALMQVEVERCEALGIPFLVHHPGSPTGAGVEFGIGRIVEAYRRILAQTRGFQTVLCLENTVGAGSTLGGPFEELAELRRRILENAAEGERVGFCFDTCHAHAQGYDMASRAGADRVLDELDRICGLHHVRVVHLNDSKGRCGSHLDRHEHIGQGTIGAPKLAQSGFAAVVNRAELREVPKILETPKGDSPGGKGGVPYDTLNLRRLRKLAIPLEPIKTTRVLRPPFSPSHPAKKARRQPA